MNVAAGFSGLASFYYSSSSAGVVYVWSGVDGTGTLLDAFTLTNNAQAGGCSDSPLCHWDPATVNLGSKVAKSITFGDAAGVAGFDNVSVNTVPEPESYALMVLGLAAIGVWLRSARGRQARA